MSTLSFTHQDEDQREYPYIGVNRYTQGTLYVLFVAPGEGLILENTVKEEDAMTKGCFWDDFSEAGFTVTHGTIRL